jgi:hypothetical protein
MKFGLWKKRTGNFRLIRVFSVEHNVQRLKAYAKRLKRLQRARPEDRKFRLIVRRGAHKKNAPYLAQQPDTGRGDGITWPPA